MSHLYAGSEAAGEPLLPTQSSISLLIEEPSQIGEARRGAASMATSLQFGDVAKSNLSIVVTEAANNLHRHAGRGEILLRPVLNTEGVLGIELLALDKGPGISNIAQCMEDGFSTGGTAGTGLGAMKRLSASLDFYTYPGMGTALVAYAWAKPTVSGTAVGPGLVNRPKPGQEVCGDSWAMKREGHRLLFMVVDGLGHGPDAAVASAAAVTAFYGHIGCRPGDLLDRIHTALHGSRGAAAAIAEIDEDTGTICFAGIGNIAGAILQGNLTSNMVSHYGIVGYQVRKIQEFNYPYLPGALVVMSSDGIATLGPLSVYHGLLTQPTALIASVLYREFQRINDDATILVARIAGRENGKASL